MKIIAFVLGLIIGLSLFKSDKISYIKQNNNEITPNLEFDLTKPIPLKLKQREIVIKIEEKKIIEEPLTDIEQLIKDQFGDDYQIAKAIFTAESGLIATQTHTNDDGSVDYGIAQINSCHADKVDGDLNRLLDAKTNIKVAYQIYQDSGWYPWTVYKTGAYKKYLEQ